MSAAASTDRTAARAGSPSIATLLLKPVLVLVFALLHIAYQVMLLIHQTGTTIKSATKRRPAQPPASYTSLEELLAAHDCASNTVRVPQHLAVVLVDAEPSSIRLYLSRLFARDAAALEHDVWHDFRAEFHTAMQAKHCSDIAAIVHLARISGVQQLSVYTQEPLCSSALQSLSRALLVGYRTKAVFAEEDKEHGAEESKVDGAAAWSRYEELRRRRPAKDASSDSSSSPASLESSDSEATPSSLDDDTLASSYTADSNDAPLYDASVTIRLGLDSTAQKTGPGLQVTLLSRLDGQQRFASLVSADIHQRCSTYITTTVLPDIHTVFSSTKRLSASTLRKSWLAQRHTSTGALTVGALDRTLLDAGYLGEPDLLAVFGPATAKRLHGFPAWPLRVTDLFYDAAASGRRGYGVDDWIGALRKLARMEQRYGR
ncbi:conserved hypothetical protein [Sporisorium reilianum SRZ2]|uniref:ditrans,polycis-polyprenyl diphosphate synthase [(2E,6E)-farnesyldiphosphate specific] n=1 Tax=Sporisorium reilianum (strain SRZ2) TaxID=999809 RepID=E6ZR22_SPORE|nr:conserved hypothetical protein [Sporisorium reilianum SRZ2]